MSEQKSTSRRSVIRAGAAATLTSMGTGAALLSQSGPSLALTAQSLSVTNASITTDDGTISGVTLKDSADGDNACIDLSWEGFETASETVNFYIEVRLPNAAAGSGGSFE